MEIKRLPHNAVHTDAEFADADVAVGNEIAEAIGDTFIDHTMTPVEQWQTIVRALRLHGLKITEEVVAQIDQLKGDS